VLGCGNPETVCRCVVRSVSVSGSVSGSASNRQPEDFRSRSRPRSGAQTVFELSQCCTRGVRLSVQPRAIGPGAFAARRAEAAGEMGGVGAAEPAAGLGHGHPGEGEQAIGLETAIGPRWEKRPIRRGCCGTGCFRHSGRSSDDTTFRSAGSLAGCVMQKARPGPLTRKVISRCTTKRRLRLRSKHPMKDNSTFTACLARQAPVCNP
jgi:hypothetical protein